MEKLMIVLMAFTAGVIATKWFLSTKKSNQSDVKAGGGGAVKEKDRPSENENQTT